MNDIRPGTALPTREFAITRADLRAYAEASGDHNPIHLDEAAARALGLPGVVAHGMLTMALAVQAVADWAGGADRVCSTRVRFTNPVVVPAEGAATLVVDGTVRGPVAVEVPPDATDAPDADDSTDVGGHADPGEDAVEVAVTATCAGRRVFGKAVVVVRPAGGGPAPGPRRG